MTCWYKSMHASPRLRWYVRALESRVSGTDGPLRRHDGSHKLYHQLQEVRLAPLTQGTQECASPGATGCPGARVHHAIPEATRTGCAHVHVATCFQAAVHSPLCHSIRLVVR
jgi:hypothetical protein